MGFFSSELFTSQLEAADKVEIGLFSQPGVALQRERGEISDFFAGLSLKSKFEGLDGDIPDPCTGNVACPGMGFLLGMRGRTWG